MSLDDLYDVMALRQEVFVVEQTSIYLDADGHDQRSLHLLGRDPQGNLVAYLRLLPPGEKYVESSIGRVIVSASARGGGVGVELMRRGIARAVEDYPGTGIRISAQEYLLKFYGDLGFASVGESYLEDGIPHLEMVWGSSGGFTTKNTKDTKAHEGMSEYKVGREMILDGLRGRLASLGYVQAMWEGRPAAFDRVDAWSDIDLSLVVEDDRVADAFAEVEAALAEVSPIDIVHAIPEPTWHGHSQKFYRLRDASPFLLIDLSVMKQSSQEKFLARETHGTPLVHFDKGEWTLAPAFEAEDLEERLRRRRQTLSTTFDLFRILVIKELNRHNDIEAVAFYHGFTLRPLVELLRMKYAPARHGFHTRYVHYDFPEEIQIRLHDLFFVSDADDLRRKQAEAETWFEVEMESFGKSE